MESKIHMMGTDSRTKCGLRLTQKRFLNMTTDTQKVTCNACIPTEFMLNPVHRLLPKGNLTACGMSAINKKFLQKCRAHDTKARITCKACRDIEELARIKKSR